MSVVYSPRAAVLALTVLAALAASYFAPSAYAVPNPPADSNACHDGTAPAPGPPLSQEYELGDVTPPIDVGGANLRGGAQGFSSTKYTVYNDVCIRGQLLGITVLDSYQSTRANQQDGDRSGFERFTYTRTPVFSSCLGVSAGGTGGAQTDTRCP